MKIEQEIGNMGNAPGFTNKNGIVYVLESYILTTILLKLIKQDS